jgi:hypothetical protein
MIFAFILHNQEPQRGMGPIVRFSLSLSVIEPCGLRSRRQLCLRRAERNLHLAIRERGGVCHP